MNRRSRLLLSVLLLGMAVAAGAALVHLYTTGSGSLSIGPVESKIDSVTVEMDHTVFRMDLRDERGWTMSPPSGFRASEARVEQLLRAFGDGIESDLSSRLEDDPGRFGLDADGVIRLRMFSDGESVLDLEIGSTQRHDDASVDTFVRVPSSLVVYRVIGRDLREPFGQGADYFRAGRLFDFSVDMVDAVEYFDPSDRDGAGVVKVAFEGDRSSAIASTMWKIVSPAGWAPGRIHAAVAQAASVMFSSWNATVPDGFDIGEDSAGARIHLVDGRSVEIRVSGPADGYAWAAVSGVEGFFRMRESDAALFVKKIQDLTDLSLFALKREDIASVAIRRNRGDSLSVSRKGNDFVSGGHPEMVLDRSAVEDWLRGLLELRAVGMMSGSENQPAEKSGIEVVFVTRDGREKRFLFGPPDDRGIRLASGKDLPGTFMVVDAGLSPLRVAKDSLRVRSVFGSRTDVGGITAIKVRSPVFGQVVLSPPAGNSKNWSATFGPGNVVSDQTVTTIAGSVMSLSASGFVDVPPAGSVQPDELEIVYQSKGKEIVLKVSSRVSNDSLVAAVVGNRAMSRQAFLIPKTAIDTISSIYLMRR